MSVVVAIKEGGKVYVGADSQVTKGGTRTTLLNPNNYKIWKVRDAENCLMAHVGWVREANVVRTLYLVDDYDVYRDCIDFRFVVKSVIPEITKALGEARYLKEGYIESMESSYLFIYRDRIFNIGSDLSVVEVEDYVAIGSGANQAIGSLLSTEGKKPEERIVMAIKASAASDIYVDYPIIITDSESTEFKVINEDDEINKKGKKHENNTK